MERRSGTATKWLLSWIQFSGGGMNALKPPYTIQVVNTAHLAPELKELIRDLSVAMEETRTRRLARTREDVAVSLQIADQSNLSGLT